MKNNKGFLLYEMLLGMTLMVIITIFVLNVILDLKGVSDKIVLEVTLNTSQASFTKMIEDDLINDTLVSLETISENEYLFTFNNVGEKTLKIDADNNVLTYGNYSKKVTKGASIVKTTYVRTTTVDNAPVNKFNTLLVIDIPIVHQNLHSNYGIHIVNQFDSRVNNIFNSPTLTLNEYIKSDIKTSGDGLYFANNVYAYKGENPNNYVYLNGYLFRIMNINDSEGYMKLVYEGVKDTNGGTVDNGIAKYTIYNKTDSYSFEDSTAFESTNSFINNLFSDKNLLKETESCITSNIPTSSTTTSLLTSDCSEKSIYKSYASIYTASDYLNASLDTGCKKIGDAACKNKNYLYKDINTISGGTAMTIATSNSSSTGYYYVASAGYLATTTTASEITSDLTAIRPVIYLNKDVKLKSGNGTYEYPYKVGL